MDFYKSSSTSSNHSSNSHSSNHSNVSSSSSKSNGGPTYNLEYCTSSSSLSPPILPYDASETAMMAKTSSMSTSHRLLPSSSSASSAVNVGIYDEVIISSSDGSQSSVSSSTVTALLYSSSQKTAKRKRKASITLDIKDSDLGIEPPSAKRQQRVPSLYQSDTGSIVSSVYASSPDAGLEQVIDTPRSSSECLSPTIEFDVAAHEDIPDSPDSLQHENEYDLDDEVDDDDEIVSGTSSPSVYSATSSNLHTHTNSRLHTHSPHHHGERTPGTHSEMHTNCNSTSADNEPTKDAFLDDFLLAAYDCMTPAAETDPPRQCPLPALAWANAQDVWQLMCKKDELESCLRDTSMLEHHPGLQPRMRAILLDWLIEVCEVYKLHRETYYLAVDYLDRYLSAKKPVQKTHLQLIGITCLFVAAKVEEIYPPKIGEFAYVTDGACQESDILQHEILLLQALDWNINPVTPMSWLGIYMQLNVNNRTPASFGKSIVKNEMASSSAVSTSTAGSTCAQAVIDDAFIYPQFSGLEFVQTAQLLDLCSLDVGIAHFPYSVMAAAAISHTFNRETALRCSGFDWHTIQTCSRWMKPFFHVIREESKYLQLLEQNEQLPTKFGLGHVCPNIITDDSHIMQTHTTTMTMFDRACLLQEQYLTVAAKIKQEASPGTTLICPEGLLTPPASSRKPLDSLDEAADEAGTNSGAAVDAEHHPSVSTDTAASTSNGGNR